MDKLPDSNNSKHYITDFISGHHVIATPEEVEAVQVFSKILVEDYGYPKEHIRTRPQYHVSKCPSDTKGSYPVDIAVFKSDSHTPDSLYIIVECKRKERKDGRIQLESYLGLSKAQFGIWFNGKEKLFLRKTGNPDCLFEEIPNIPKYNQRLEDIGKFKKRDLKPTNNLKSIFKSIRNYLTAISTGTNRDEIIAQQLINVIFCKIFDERFTEKDKEVSFRTGIDEDAEIVKNRILDIFNKVKEKYKSVLTASDSIILGASEIKYIVGELQNYSLINCERDVIAEAFETFIQDALKGGQGQFFTPRNVVQLMVTLVDPKQDKYIIDPACGTGGFLVETLRYVWKKIDKWGQLTGNPQSSIDEEKREFALNKLKGIEKDAFLCKVAKAYMAILGDGRGGLFCENSIDIVSNWNLKTRQDIDLNKFDFLLANPPFGKDIKVRDSGILNTYDLAHQWQKKNQEFKITDKVKEEVTIQILFIERSLKLLNNKGKMGIILPETYFHAPSMKHILDYMVRGNNVEYIIDLPYNTFRPYNNAKCIALILQKGVPQNKTIKMIVAEEIGHDHNGKPLYRWDYKKDRTIKDKVWDDIPLILKEIKNGNNKYVFDVDSSEVENKGVYIPRYYWKNKLDEIQEIAQKNNLELIPIDELINNNIITYFDGHGSPESQAKGKGEIPYIRVKDIVNWEIYKNPTSLIPESVYNSFIKGNQNICEKDIAFVRRGSYRIGSVAMVSPYDLKALYTREILFLRVKEQQNEFNITPYYLLYLLSHNLVKMQENNKILIETTLPNIGERWKELYLPVSRNIEERINISNQIKQIIQKKWDAIEEINNLKAKWGNFTT